jgi:hypothetical protein
MAREYPLTFYNLDNNRDPDRVAKEIRALLEPRPAILGMCEATGYGNLPGVEDYQLIRDRSKPGRDNVAAYVKLNLELSAVKWLDLTETWTKTESPGTHWPRSILEFRAGRLMVWVHHQPPKGTDNTKRAQQEGIAKLTARMAPWTRDDWDERTQEDKQQAKAQARLVLWDANRLASETGPGPGQLAANIDGWNAGQKIDLATYRGGEAKGHEGVNYPSQVSGVELKSDHGHAYQCRLLLSDAT